MILNISTLQSVTKPRKEKMNRLIPGGLFSTRAAEVQQLRERIHTDTTPLSQRVTDVRKVETFWDRAAQGLRAQDPGGAELAELMKQTKK